MGPPITIERLRELEKHIGAGLPEDYVSFLLETNGGAADSAHCVFDIHTNGRPNTTILNCFLSVADPDEASDLAERWDLSRRWLPPELMPIAYDDGGGSVLLALDGRHRGEVWYLDGVVRRPEGSNPRVNWYDRRDVCRLASSFSAFVEMLRPQSR